MAFCYVKSREEEYRTGEHNKNNHKALGKKKSIIAKKKRTKKKKKVKELAAIALQYKKTPENPSSEILQ